jgi:hypothetical protein
MPTRMASTSGRSQRVTPFIWLCPTTFIAATPCARPTPEFMCSAKTDGGADYEAMIDAANSNRQKLMIAYLLHFEKANLEADPVGQKRQARKCANLIGEKVSTRKFAKRDQFAAELIHFSNCVLENKEPEPSGHEGLSDVRIVRAIHKAAQTGKMIELGDFSFKKKPTMRQEIDRPAHGKPKTVNAESPSGE